MNKILDGLNPPQKEAVQHTEGPILILAGAGSGKTRVITHRMAFLIEKGIPSRQILGVTFTNKAAGEMRRRVVRLSGIRGEGVFISTFHSFCARLLRADIDKIDGNPYFAIYDESDQQDIVKDCLRELDLDPKQFIPAIMVELISRAKDSLMDAENYISSVPPQHHFEKVTGEVYRIYQKKIEKNGGLDFGDLLMKTVVMLKKRKDVLEKYQERFRYIMVD